MLVAPAVCGVEARGVDDQLDCPPARADRVGALEPPEAPDDGGQPPEVLHRELDRRPHRIGDPPLCRLCRWLIARNAHLVAPFEGFKISTNGSAARGQLSRSSCKSRGGWFARGGGRSGACGRG